MSDPAADNGKQQKKFVFRPKVQPDGAGAAQGQAAADYRAAGHVKHGHARRPVLQAVQRARGEVLRDPDAIGRFLQKPGAAWPAWLKRRRTPASSWSTTAAIVKPSACCRSLPITLMTVPC